ncbi:MAG: hypothetical protein CMF98_05075 [Candidatus Marinimicrobia bacterium]|nr:hypothetical protein [Candidatus Neomarinimicrobiota bacterium]OUW50209.1 MAG: hypothetical protein CBD50_03670 [bacterium TMED190]|tara:strand:+ start:12359 stop:13450 length:1092 start_codon:yes stop_codon:yes gene_type:complete
MFKVLLLFLIFFNSLHTIPRFSLIEGTSCKLCHVNPNGGSLRNDYGIIIASEDITYEKSKTIINNNDLGEISDHIRIGADLRIQSINDKKKNVIFPMQLDLYSYFNYNNLLGFYIESEALIDNTEYWTIAYLPIFDGYVKAGKSKPYFGLNIDDHTSFIRGGNINRKFGLDKEGSIFSPYQKPVNIIEVGLNFSEISIITSIANNFIGYNSSNIGFLGIPNKRTYSFRAEAYSKFLNNNIFYGLSYIEEEKIKLKSLFSGFFVNKVSMMTEIDIIENWVNDKQGMATFSEIAFMYKPGLNILFQYNFYDEDIQFQTNVINRYAVGIEFFLFNFWEFKFQTRYNKLNNLNFEPIEFITQSHFWF